MGGVHRLLTLTARLPRLCSLRTPTKGGPSRRSPCWLIFLTVLLLLSGCAWPSLFKRTPTVPPPSPTIQAQTRLLNDAQDQLQRGRAREAVQLLRNLIDSYPQSPFIPEMRWTLARAYEQSGDLGAAMEEYRRIIGAEESGRSGEVSYAEEARLRITALEPNLEPVRKKPSEVTAILVQPHHLPPRADLPQWLQNLARTGVTTLILEAATKPGQVASLLQTSLPSGHHQASSPAGVYFRTQWAPVLDDYIDQVVPLAHEQGLSVFGALALRRMSWLEPPAGWADWAYNPVHQKVERSVALDLFHPGFQEYLTGLLGDLADTGIDGFLFRADAPMGPNDGFSPFALDGFRQSFEIELHPSTLFIRSEEKASVHATTKEGREFPGRSRYAPEFWRWAGWKTREQLHIMSRVKDAMRGRSPNLTFALELHPEAVHDPVHALVHYTEDLLEAKRAGFEYILTGDDNGRIVSRLSGSQRSSLADVANNKASTSTLDHLIDLLGDARRVWMAISVPSRDIAILHRRLNPQADRVSIANTIGLVYVVHTPHVP